MIIISLSLSLSLSSGNNKPVHGARPGHNLYDEMKPWGKTPVSVAIPTVKMGYTYSFGAIDMLVRKYLNPNF